MNYTEYMSKFLVKLNLLKLTQDIEKVIIIFMYYHEEPKCFFAWPPDLVLILSNEKLGYSGTSNCLVIIMAQSFLI